VQRLDRLIGFEFHRVKIEQRTMNKEQGL
jgi:hypothetical protein